MKRSCAHPLWCPHTEGSFARSWQTGWQAGFGECDNTLESTHWEQEFSCSISCSQCVDSNALPSLPIPACQPTCQLLAKLLSVCEHPKVPHSTTLFLNDCSLSGAIFSFFRQWHVSLSLSWKNSHGRSHPRCCWPPVIMQWRLSLHWIWKRLYAAALHGEDKNSHNYVHTLQQHPCIWRVKNIKIETCGQSPSMWF